jgi:hypothetical protein
MEDFDKKVSIKEPMETEKPVAADSPKVVDLLRRFLAVQQRRAEAYAKLKKFAFFFNRFGM